MEKRFSYSIFIIIQFLFIIQLNAQDGITLNAKVFLSGCYSEGEMRTDILNNNLIPTSQPYNVSVWNYNGSESVTNVPPNIVDWILIELRSDLNTKISQKAAFIRKDGQIVDLDGTSNPIFSSIQQGEYYIVIYHRNHLAIMSSSKTLFNNNSPLYNFTDQLLKAYGPNSLLNLGDGNFGMIAGDGDQNGIVNNADYGLVANNIFNSAYISVDLDMSGFVNVMDYSKVYGNILRTSSVPEIISDIIYVTNFNDLKLAVDTAQSGSVIQIQNDIEFPTSETETYALRANYAIIIIDKSLTIQGATHATKPRLWNGEVDPGDIDASLSLFGIEDANVTFRNLIFDGSEDKGSLRVGLIMGGQFYWTPDYSSNVLIDSCDIKGWWYGGVYVSNDARLELKNSYIYNNRGIGLGYGVVHGYGGHSIVHHCVFDSNRHDIASNGWHENGYELYENDFYPTAFPSQHNVDTHNQGGWYDEDSVDYNNYASDSLVIHNNRFHGYLHDSPTTKDASLATAIKIRGKPKSGAWIYDNEFDHFGNAGGGIDQWSSSAVAMADDQNGGYDGHFGPYANVFIGDNTYNAIDAVNGTYEIFQVKFTGGDWANWTPFGLTSNYPSTYPIDSLLYGDFNGDGVTDVVTNYFGSSVSNGFYSYAEETYIIPGDTSLYIRYAGIAGKNLDPEGPYRTWREFDTTDVYMSQLSARDVTGDGKTDLVRITASDTTYIQCGSTGIYGTTGGWQTLPNPYNTYTLYTARDFNGDGIDEEVRVTTVTP